MKKIVLFAVACVALASCIKPEITESNIDSYFEEGQTVTLTVNAATRATGAYNSTNNNIAFTWSDGDAVKVTVGGKTATFTLLSGAGESSATFTGKMPASGSTFNVQYPASDSDPDISSQTYVENGIANGLMKATASNCSSDTHVNMAPQNSVLKVNLYGTNKTVGKIVVTNTSSDASPKPSYTLNITGGKAVGTSSATATPFFIVVPSGDYEFSAEVFDNAATPASICTFETNNAKTFTNGEFLNMTPVSLSTRSVLLSGEFSVSSTKRVHFASGNLYWDGSNFKIEDSQTSFPTSWNPSHVGHFYWADTEISAYAESLPGEPSKRDSAVFFFAEGNSISVEGENNLYSLTSEEWDYLIKTRPNASNKIKSDVTVNGKTGLVIAPDNYSGTIASSYTDAAWTTAESAGLVCLPYTGDRSPNFITDLTYGKKYYLTSTVFFHYDEKAEETEMLTYVLSAVSKTIATLKGDSGFCEAYPIRPVKTVK